MELAKHIERICKIEDIEIASHSRGGRANRRQRLIKIRPDELSPQDPTFASYEKGGGT